MEEAKILIVTAIIEIIDNSLYRPNEFRKDDIA